MRNGISGKIFQEQRGELHGKHDEPEAELPVGFGHLPPFPWPRSPPQLPLPPSPLLCWNCRTNRSIRLYLAHFVSLCSRPLPCVEFARAPIPSPSDSPKYFSKKRKTLPVVGRGWRRTSRCFYILSCCASLRHSTTVEAENSFTALEAHNQKRPVGQRLSVVHLLSTFLLLRSTIALILLWFIGL